MSSKQGYLVEFITMGQSIKVCAIDPETGTEVSIVAPSNISQKEMEQTAVKKLLYVLNKKAKENAPNKKGRGIII